MAQDAAVNVFPLTVEFVGTVPGFDWVTQAVVRLPDNVPSGQPVFLYSDLSRADEQQSSHSDEVNP